MTYRIMIRERGKGEWEPHNGPVETRQQALEEATKTVLNSGFDAFQIWELVDQQELQPQLVSAFPQVKEKVA